MKYHIVKIDCFRLVATDGERESYWNWTKDRFIKIRTLKKSEYKFADVESAVRVIETPGSATLHAIDKRRVPAWADCVEIRAYGVDQREVEKVEVVKVWNINRPWSEKKKVRHVL